MLLDALTYLVCDELAGVYFALAVACGLAVWVCYIIWDYRNVSRGE